LRFAGLAIAQVLATRPDTIVFAGAREPAAAAELQALAKSHPGALHVVKLTSANEADNRAAVEEIKRVAGRLDVVIANAGAMPRSDLVRTRSHAEPGIAKWTGEAVTAPLDAMREHFEVRVLLRGAVTSLTMLLAQVNVLGVLVLFQAAYPLLKSSTPKFVPISSSAGSITVGPTLPVRNMPCVLCRRRRRRRWLRRCRAIHAWLC
jgi:NAD(P)-dependent dehydrogenase (short-subunit alcohol dehydrogenase family)